MTPEPGPARPRWDASWYPASEAVERMQAFPPGAAITVGKWSPAGTEVTRYPAHVVASAAPSPWLEVVATWTTPAVDVAGLAFVPGDTLREFFSPIHPFNAFAVIAPGNSLRGWYGNVTFPTFVVQEEAGPVLVWHDLYLDAILLPDGTTHLLDDDELEDSGLPASNPDFAAAILQAREDLIATIPTLLPWPTD